MVLLLGAGCKLCTVLALSYAGCVLCTVLAVCSVMCWLRVPHGAGCGGLEVRDLNPVYTTPVMCSIRPIVTVCFVLFDFL